MAKKLRWTDVQDIAIELEERHPDIDNVNLRFTDLHRFVTELGVQVVGGAGGCLGVSFLRLEASTIWVPW